MRSLLIVATLLVLLSAVGEGVALPGLRLLEDTNLYSPSSELLVVGAAQMTVISPHGDSPADHKAAAMANANKIVNITVSPRNTPLDLVVFPEFELYGGLDFLKCKGAGGSQAVMTPYCEVIPGIINDRQFSNLNIDLSSNCSDVAAVSNSMLLTIACGTKISMTAVSYNACESANDVSGNPVFYNTQVVLQNGTLLAKYRKYHVFETDCFAIPAMQLVTFSLLNKPPVVSGSNFTFGLFTCFDIVFNDPKEALVAAGVKYFSYSSAIPLVAREAVKLFSWANNVTVVASNANEASSEVIRDGKELSKCSTGEDGCVAVSSLSA